MGIKVNIPVQFRRKTDILSKPTAVVGSSVLQSFKTRSVSYVANYIAINVKVMPLIIEI